MTFEKKKRTFLVFQIGSSVDPQTRSVDFFLYNYNRRQYKRNNFIVHSQNVGYDYGALFSGNRIISSVKRFIYLSWRYIVFENLAFLFFKTGTLTEIREL